MGTPLSPRTWPFEEWVTSRLRPFGNVTSKRFRSSSISGRAITAKGAPPARIGLPVGFHGRQFDRLMAKNLTAARITEINLKRDENSRHHQSDSQESAGKREPASLKKEVSADPSHDKDDVSKEAISMWPIVSAKKD